VSYKRIDLAVRAFNQLGKELVIIGEGAQLKELKKIAKPNIKFLGWQKKDVLKQYYSQAKAFIFPGEEDFGITPVEAQASGTPVIGYGRGGLLETVKENETGLFFYRQQEQDLIDIINYFEQHDDQFDPDNIRKNSLRFSRDRFEQEMLEFCQKKYKKHQHRYMD
jgi:glycosyltransferase involved in cell wall biosynthesis